MNEMIKQAHTVSLEQKYNVQVEDGGNEIGLPFFTFDEKMRLVGASSDALSLVGIGRDALNRTLSTSGCAVVNTGGEELAEDGFSRLMGCQRTVMFGLRPAGSWATRWLRGRFRAVHFGEVKTPRKEAVRFDFVEVSDLVSEQRAAHQVQQAKREWETTVDALQDVVTIQDLNMKIVRANKKAHDIFGYKLGALTGKKCYEAFFQRAAPCVGCPVPETLQDCRQHSGTLYLPELKKTFGISSFPIMDVDGKMHQLVHVARDVTKYLENESAKNRLMAAIEQASESVVISDSKGEIQYVNPAFEQTSGYHRQEVLGRKLNILKSGVHDTEFYREMWQTLLKRQVWRGRLTNRRKDGSLFKEDATISPVQDENGQITNYVAMKRDVTREEQLEQQLYQAMKMEALGTLAGGIAHDFNNILSGIIGYGELARGRIAPDHPARREIDRLLEGGDRAVDLVRQILTFSRRESTDRFRPVRVQAVIEEVIKLLRASLPATIELVTNVEATCRPTFADPGQIYQVVMNLATNARQAIGENHGRIEITLKEVVEETGRQTPEQPIGKQGYLVLKVSDTGCGIPDAVIGRIFDPFFTTKKQEHGTGLGLAVVHGIVKRHRGELQVFSTPGQGSSFQVFLAAGDQEAEHFEEVVKTSVSGNERIMIIDDEAVITDVLRESLQKVGYQIQTFNGSIEAVKQFRADPDCCDLVITDMIMPRMTGAELAREVRALRADLPIIMLTGHSENFDANRAMRIGITRYLLKPVKIDALQHAVREVLNRGADSRH